MGTPTHAYDKEGKEVWYRELDVYGRCIKGDNDFIPFLYQGQYYDKESGLAYNRYRYYDPKIGTYISQDPIGLLGGMVLYGYVHDVNLWVDKMGLSKGSTALDKALGGTKYDNKMAHHLIPEKTWDKFETNLFSKIGLSGQRDVASNGLLMSDSKSAAKAHGNKLYHSTRHREYTKMVEKKLTSIQYRLDQKYITPAEAKQQVESLQRSLRKKIESGKIKTKTPCGRLS